GFTPFESEVKTTTLGQKIPAIQTSMGSVDISSKSTHSTEPWIGAFTSKLPFIVFFFFSIVMAFLCLSRRLSLIPVLGVMCCTYLMTELGWTNWFRFGIWLIVGLIVYFFYSFKHSKLHLRETVAEEATP
ncbi:MAG: amino acid permease C-terminal domain-containing protein, partial [Pyrinomonadaceae bacterium]